VHPVGSYYTDLHPVYAEYYHSILFSQHHWQRVVISL